MPTLRAGKRRWSGRITKEQMDVLHSGPFLDGDELLFEPPGAPPPPRSWGLSPAALEAARVCWEANKEQILDAWFSDPNDVEGDHWSERPWCWWQFVADRPYPGRQNEPAMVKEIERRLELNERRRAAAAKKKENTK